MDFVCNVALANNFDVKKLSADGQLLALCVTFTTTGVVACICNLADD